MGNSIETRLRELGIALPAVPAPLANYVPFVLSGSLLFLAGQGPRAANDEWMRGRLGAGVSIEAGYQHARLCGLRLLSAAQAALGSLDRVRRVVKVTGFVNSTPDFGEHPAVINGCSDLLVEVFGEAGRHARSALGVSNLPLGTTVEVEAVLEVA